ncbi:MAG TPA: hypothetical protein DHW82_04975 [Spirochaetia bacterium]|nr:MAG: hypothetical protein A2Y41_13190 [Spirochaetes bacterium GWB1_36_13]HCL56345.1 hypothetical protein [Spirochaetia bacterium]
MLDGLLMIVIGALAAMSLITKKIKDSEKVLNVLIPFQGYIGFGAFVWGVWGIIRAVLWTSLIATWPIWWITFLAMAVVETVLGFMLGFGLISKWVLSKNEEAKKKGEEILKKLSTYQVLFGLIGIGVGIWLIVYTIVFYRI